MPWTIVSHLAPSFDTLAPLGVAPFVLLRQFGSRIDDNATFSQLTALLG